MENRDEVKLQKTNILSDGYGLIPKKITRDKDLTMEAKAIYAYLASFAGNSNMCFPSRDLILSELGTSKDRFYKHMKLLTNKGYIKVHKKREGKNFSNNVYEIILDKRDFQCPSFKDTENKDTENKDTLCPDFTDTQNKDNNSNSINSNSINSKYIDKENKPNKLKEFRILYEQNIGLINGITAEYLIELSEIIDVNLFKKSIEIATDKGKCNLGYIKGIIKQWLDANIRTLEQLEAYKLQQQSKKDVKANGSSTKRTNQFEQQISDDDEKDEEYYRLLAECERLSRE